MKVTIDNKEEEKKVFKPFKLTFDIETIEEARLMFHICNCYSIDTLLKANYSEFNYNTDMSKEIDDIKSSILIKNEIEKQGFEL